MSAFWRCITWDDRVQYARAVHVQAAFTPVSEMTVSARKISTRGTIFSFCLVYWHTTHAFRRIPLAPRGAPGTCTGYTDASCCVTSGELHLPECCILVQWYIYTIRSHCIGILPHRGQDLHVRHVPPHMQQYL